MTTEQQSVMEEFKQHFNEPVIVGTKVGRVIGFADTDDYYLIVQFKGGDILWQTAVGGYCWLNLLKEQGKVIFGEEEWNDFIRLDDLLELNGAPRREIFLEIYQEPY
jgi:hypothetical protein